MNLEKTNEQPPKVVVPSTVVSDGPYKIDLNSTCGWSASGPGVFLHGRDQRGNVQRSETSQIVAALNAAWLLGRASTMVLP